MKKRQSDKLGRSLSPSPDSLSAKLRDQDNPTVLGYELRCDTLTPVRKALDLHKPGDYGCDPLGDGTFRMVPSGDIVDFEERNRRLGASKL